MKKGYLPTKRADGCKDEYEQVQKAFQRLITPHIDLALAREVMDRSWLPDPATKLLPPSVPKPKKSKSSGGR